MRGRPRRPTHLKLVTGTTRSHKRGAKPNDREPTAPRSDLTPPEHLSPRAVECWTRIAPMLDKMGVLTIADNLALAELSEAFADMIVARALLAAPVVADGVTVAEAGAPTYVARTREGFVIRPRPELTIIAEASRRFNNLLGCFGLSPATRSKISLADAPTADPSDSYFS